MNAQKNRKGLFSRELQLTLLLWVIYLIIPYLVVPERYAYSLAPSELAIKASYLMLALLNNYVLIPRFLHKSKYALFSLLVLATIALGALFEESILEYLFFPDTRGAELTMSGLQWSASKIGFVLILFSTFKLIWDYQKKQQQMNELENEKIASELKFLKSQVNPHVLFNNLNNIYSYALEKSEKVPEMLLKLSDIMRYMLNEEENQFVRLDKEIRYLEDFIELQKLRLEGRGDVSLTVTGNPENYSIAPLLLVAFVENSFKHSMQTEVDNIVIDIKLDITDGMLNFVSRNSYSEDGGPSLANKNGRETGIGLQNVKKRLKLIYHDKHNLNISKENNFFVVELSLDLSVNEPEMFDH
ncbi:GHKL domain-containing protein [Balneolaceae bacterium YR4-1]|uniref:GHKL domain-containing protein n=1 Tax=Halalkalibaculum roseum TaxID=2709311 RepID=A0A6M1T7L2_9BACT|nr:histidine kinase [Halalkalibaculum roseum]NGP77945.1 GHKL domain-containing protein [Halalkalibaculum roseum]